MDGFGLLVESGATKTEVTIAPLECGGDLGSLEGSRSERFETPADKSRFIEELHAAAVRGRDALGIRDLRIHRMELSSAGIIMGTHVKATNTPGLAYDLREIADRFRKASMPIGSFAAHNDMVPGVAGAIALLRAPEFDFGSPRVTVLRRARAERVTRNIVYSMPGTGYGVGLALGTPSGVYAIVTGELGHALPGNRGLPTESALIAFVSDRIGRACEYEHLVAGKFIGWIFEFLRQLAGRREDLLRGRLPADDPLAARLDPRSLGMMREEMEDLDPSLRELSRALEVPEQVDSEAVEGMAPGIAAASLDGNEAARRVLGIATRFYVRSLIDQANALNAGVVVMTGHFIAAEENRYVREVFPAILEEEAGVRVHRQVYLERTDFVAIADPAINTRGLARLCRQGGTA